MKLLPVILFILIVCYCCLTIGTRASTSDVTDTTQNVTSTICRPYLRNYNETEMETEENLLLQGGVLTNYKANAAYLPWELKQSIKDSSRRSISRSCPVSLESSPPLLFDIGPPWPSQPSTSTAPGPLVYGSLRVACNKRC